MDINQEETINKCKAQLQSATTVEELVSISNSFKGLINDELLIELQMKVSFYFDTSCSEAELEYLKNKITKNDSDLIGTN